MLSLTSAVPNHTLRHLLIAAALVFTQQAAQLHALSHVQHDMAKAERSGKCVPPVNHPAEQCIAFHAGDSVRSSSSPVRSANRVRFARASRTLLVRSLGNPASLARSDRVRERRRGASRSKELGETTCTERQLWRSPSRRRSACPTPRGRRLKTS